MSDITLLILQSLVRTTLWLSVVALVVGLALRFARPRWATAHRLAWLLVIVVGWSFLRVPLAVPWYEVERVEPPTAAELPALPPSAPTALVADLAEPARSTDEPPATIEIAKPAIVPVPRDIPEPATVRSNFYWALALLAAWAMGIVALPLVWLIGYVRFWRSLTPGKSIDEPYQAEWHQLAAEAGLRQPIPLRMTGQLGPMLCRLPRGYQLLVPERLWRELSADERRAILRHELAHYQRGDVWKSLAARLLALPHWFNPASWYAVRRFEEAAEWACDRAAAGDDAATDYARLLVRLGELPTSAASYGPAARGRSLAARVRRILAEPKAEDSLMKKSLLIGCGLILALASGVQLQLVARQPAESLPERARSAWLAADRQPGSATAKDPSSPPAKSVEELFHDPFAQAPQPRRQDTTPDDEPAAESTDEPADTSDDPFGDGTKQAPQPRREDASRDRDPKAEATHAMQLLDLRIKLAEIKGQIRQAEAELAGATAESGEAIRANKTAPASISRIELARRNAAQSRARAQLESLNEQLKLHDEKLALTTSAAKPQAGKPTEGSAKATTANTKTPSKAVARYDGKTFDEWAEELRTDLSPERRAAAIRALAAFSSRGMGQQAAKLILQAVRDNSIGSISLDSVQSILQPAAFEAFRNIPKPDSFRLVARALKSDQANERLFAVMVLPHAASKEERDELLAEMLKDSDDDVRRYAAAMLQSDNPVKPQLKAVLLEWLKSDDASKVLMTVNSILGTQRFSPGFIWRPVDGALLRDAMPHLLALLDREEPLKSYVKTAILMTGSDALPALQAAAKSDEPQTRRHAEAMLEHFRTVLDLPQKGPGDGQ